MYSEIQLLVMTHGELGRELIKTASLFVADTDSIYFMGLHEEDAITDYQKQLELLMKKKRDILILTDMVTAATTRVAAQALREGRVEIISGMNLAMLITAQREKSVHDLNELSELVYNAAKEDIVNIRKRLQNEG